MSLLHTPFLHLTCSTLGPNHPPPLPPPSSHSLFFPQSHKTFHLSTTAFTPISTRSKQKAKARDPDVDDEQSLMSKEEREEWRRKIREVLDKNPDPEQETDPEARRAKMEKLLAEYPLVVEEEDPDWPEDADGRGFNLDQFFDKITIKNVKKKNGNDEEEDDDDSDENEVVWQDDDYIKPIRDIRTGEWEDTVFKDFNPLVILVHNRYKRPSENEKARAELEKAIKMFWETGLPSPRCVAVDAVVEQDLVSALQVSVFPEILFTKSGKILHRDKVVRSADEWSKIMAFFYYKAVRPSCLADRTCKRFIKVKEGETCFSIARKFKLSDSVFSNINPRLPCFDLDIGQRVCVKGTI